VAEPRARPGVTRDRLAREVERSDRRWFLLTLVGSASLVGLFFGARAIYHLTGPHPQVTLFLRKVRGVARWVIPRWRRGKKWRW
jgi:hypothetical protein